MTFRGSLKSLRGGAKCKGMSLSWIQLLVLRQIKEWMNLKWPSREQLGIFVGEKLDRSCQSVCSSESKWHPGVHQRKDGQQVQGGDSPALLCCHDIPPGLLHPGHERHGSFHTGPEESHSTETFIL